MNGSHRCYSDCLRRSLYVSDFTGWRRPQVSTNLTGVNHHHTPGSPMPVDLPPVPKAYQDQLTTLSLGLALWNPNPPKEICDKVSIGDVGYLHDGTFIRMFNVMLPWSHELNRTLGEPEPYESLDCGPFANILKRPFETVKHCSRYVSAETNTGNRQALTPEKCVIILSRTVSVNLIFSQ